MRLHQLVIDSAGRYPDRLAVASTDGAGLSYRELDQQADALARVLAQAGVRHHDRVVIWAAKSPRTVVAMQAVLRLGAAYVPADLSTPLLRVAAMARDCRAAAVCADGVAADELAAELGAATRYVALDQPPPDPVPLVSDSASACTSADDLAYILYTSGSTGAPKGVCVSHRSALAFVSWAVGELAAVPDDRFANHAALTFDLSVLDLYAAFAVGASVHLIPAELSFAPAQLVRFIRDARLSIWYSVPSALILMIRSGGLLGTDAPASLRAVLFAGEPFPIPWVRSLAQWTSARLLNLYGPTETNVCTFHEAGPDDLARDRPVPIGRPCCGDQVWAQRPDGSLASAGDEGELIVDGPTVMSGYWGQPAQSGPYRTGDIVRVLDDGTFDYIGRLDHLVKVRGHRIELGEVESVLSSHPSIEQAAVCVDGTGEQARLLAFVVPATDQAPGPLSVISHCAARLPRYMIISEMRTVPELPRTGNGKIDRRRLSASLRALTAAESEQLAK